MKCDVKIMACPKRKEWVEKEISLLGITENDVFFDDRPKGGSAMYTSMKTWNLPFENDVTHRLVVQDDIMPCKGIKEAIQRIVNTYPNDIISLHTMKFHDQYLRKYDQKIPYIVCKGNSLVGQALIIPRIYIPKIKIWINNLDKNYKADDAAIGEYALKKE